ncbi:MAG TPA: DUF5655 domain-containing protein [Actinophytocola sp.]|uniref:DUF5655 domain-containing protein n=1 Tax=Actinophytocola sp. TaxID=1872138 RepID=UPI002DBAEAF8|nr:DUF5655 domain-containing protein [Actinophytocola sp.]HEU5473299.1 DUF5655 domain-containing protein [Actinophytocola sp.]
MARGPLWTCPKCGRTFANIHQTHTCAPLGSVQAHFIGKEPQVRATFDRILEIIRALGPVTVLPEKTRIALHVRMSFAAFTPRIHWLDGHLVLARPATHPTFRKIERYSPRNVLHTLRLTHPSDIDPALSALLTEAYRVGQQHHLPTPG